MNYLGDFTEDATVRVSFSTNDAAGGAVAPSDAFEAADLKIYKDGSDAEKTTTNGVTMASPFDSITGLHHVDIDTSVNTGDAGFWTPGADYKVVLVPDETVDSQTVVAVLAEFSIENRFMRGTDNAATAAQVAALNNFDPDTEGVFMEGAKNVLDDLNDLSADEITALFAGQLAAGVLVNGITVTGGRAIEITRGDVKTLTFNLGTQWPLTDKLVYFIIKKDPTADNSTAIVNRTATIIDAENGVAQITLTADETTPVDCYWYEVELRDDPADDDPQTPLRGRLTILQDVRQ